jgi:hypothetical protein
MNKPVPASPGMQPWVRDTNRRLDAAERGIARFGGISPTSRVAAFASSTEVLDSPIGATPGWLVLAGETDPQVTVFASTGQLKITVSAYMKANWTGAAAAAAGMAMRFNLAENNQLGVGTLAETFRGDGIERTAKFSTGSIAFDEACYSFSTVLAVGKQQYTIRSEYLYNHLTDGITVRWAQRSLIAEPI